MDSGIAVSVGKSITIKGANFNGKMGFESDNIFSTYYNISNDGTMSYGGAYPSIKTSLNLSGVNPSYEIYGAASGGAGSVISYTKVANLSFGDACWISSRGASSDFSIAADGGVSVGQTFQAVGAATFNSTALFSGAATYSSTATYNGVTTFNGTVNFNTGISLGTGTFTGTPTFSGNVIFSANPSFTGSPTFSGTTLTLNPTTLSIGASTATTFANTVTFSDGATFNTIAPTFPAGIGGNPNFTGTPTFANALSLTLSSLSGTITGTPTFSGNCTFSGTPIFSNSPTFSNGISTSNVTVTTEVYGVGWNGDNTVPTKDALYDKIETLQPLSTILTAINALAGTTGIIRKTSATTVTLDTATYLTATGVTAGTYKSVTVNSNGTVTAGTNPTTLAGYGITDAFSSSGGTISGTATFNGIADFNNTTTFDGASVTYSAATSVTFNGGATIGGGNLTLGGVGRRIIADFTSGTIANRAYFQTSVANGSTGVSAMPNGSGTTSAFLAANTTNTSNFNYGILACTSTEVQVASATFGSPPSANLPLTFYVGGATRAYIDASGNFAIGTPVSSNGNSHFSQSNQLFLARVDNAGSGGRMALFSPSNNAGWYVRTAGSSGTTASSIIIDNFGPSASGVGAQMTWNANTWTTVSDEREKDIIEPIVNVTYKLSKLRTVYGKYKVDEDDKRRPFLIAQDLEKDFPEVVDYLHDGKLGLRYTELIPFLVASIRELKEEIDELKKQKS